ncbi:MAG: DUF6159 family protein [Gammaproteobacteria bacterium]|nr:DUF6159 family protein [Gammaproteobacteria bacterium]
MQHPIRQFQLAKQTLAIIKQNRRVLIFPILSNLIALALFTLAAIPIYNIESTVAKTNHLGAKDMIFFIAILSVLFSIAHLSTLLFNAALSVYANKTLQGRKNSLSDGFKALITFFPKLMKWNNIMTTFGCIVCVIEYWSDHWLSSKIASRYLCNLTWTTATYFILPVLLFEKKNQTQSIKHSATLIKNNWGTVLVSKMNIRLNTMGIHILSLIPALIAFLIGGKIIISIGSTLTVIAFIIVFSINTAIRIALCNALYLFANGYDLSKFYDVNLLKNAFKLK